MLQLKTIVLLLYSIFALLAKTVQKEAITAQTVIFQSNTTKSTFDHETYSVDKKQSKKEKAAMLAANNFDYSRQKPYGKHDYIKFLEYWLIKNDGIGKAIRGSKRNVPVEVVIAKLWFESHGGHSGLAKKDPTAILGIKGNNGVKGYDDTDKSNVQYASYPNRAAALKAFNNLLSVNNGWSSKVYRERYLAWEALSNKELGTYLTRDIVKGKTHHLPLVTQKGKQPSWYYWLLAMQAHPSSDLKKSKMSYANNGWTTERINKMGAIPLMRQERLFHSQKMINFLLQDDVRSVVATYYKKYEKSWTEPIKWYGSVVSIEKNYTFKN